MRRSHVIAATTMAALGVLAGFAAPARAQTAVTVFEGARLIVGNESAPIENGTLVVDGARIVQAGRAADVTVPAGATRVNLAGKTVMPMLIDTHVHLSPTRELLTRDLRRRAYFGVSAALSMGTDNIELLPMRYETIPGAARFFSAGRGITMPEPGRITVPHWITTEAEGRKAVQELAGQKVDIVKIWVDTREGKYKKLTPEIDKTFHDAVVSFRRMSLAETSSAKPLRIRVVTAGDDDTVERLAARMAIHDRPVDRFRIINGLTAGDRIKPGDQVKIVTE